MKPSKLISMTPTGGKAAADQIPLSASKPEPTKLGASTASPRSGATQSSPKSGPGQDPPATLTVTDAMDILTRDKDQFYAALIPHLRDLFATNPGLLGSLANTQPPTTKSILDKIANNECSDHFVLPSDTNDASFISKTENLPGLGDSVKIKRQFEHRKPFVTNDNQLPPSATTDQFFDWIRSLRLTAEERGWTRPGLLEGAIKPSSASDILKWKGRGLNVTYHHVLSPQIALDIVRENSRAINYWASTNNDPWCAFLVEERHNLYQSILASLHSDLRTIFQAVRTSTGLFDGVVLLRKIWDRHIPDPKSTSLSLVRQVMELNLPPTSDAVAIDKFILTATRTIDSLSYFDPDPSAVEAIYKSLADKLCALQHPRFVNALNNEFKTDSENTCKFIQMTTEPIRAMVALRHEPIRHEPTRHTNNRYEPTRHTHDRYEPTRHKHNRNEPSRHAQNSHEPTRHEERYPRNHRLQPGAPTPPGTWTFGSRTDQWLLCANCNSWGRHSTRQCANLSRDHRAVNAEYDWSRAPRLPYPDSHRPQAHDRSRSRDRTPDKGTRSPARDQGYTRKDRRRSPSASPSSSAISRSYSE
jgi:hypothetical protein